MGPIAQYARNNNTDDIASVNEIVESTDDLAAMFPNKFRKVYAEDLPPAPAPVVVAPAVTPAPAEVDEDEDDEVPEKPEVAPVDVTKDFAVAVEKKLQVFVMPDKSFTVTKDGKQVAAGNKAVVKKYLKEAE